MTEWLAVTDSTGRAGIRGRFYSCKKKPSKRENAFSSEKAMTFISKIQTEVKNLLHCGYQEVR